MLFLTSKDEADEYWFDSKVLHIEMKARKREISCYIVNGTQQEKKNSQKFLLGLNISLKILIFPVNSGETHL